MQFDEADAQHISIEMTEDGIIHLAKEGGGGVPAPNIMVVKANKEGKIYIQRCHAVNYTYVKHAEMSSKIEVV